MLLLLRNRDTFHEHLSGGIYTNGEIVSHMVLTAINDVVASGVRPLITSTNNGD
jgi:hypothetical protein